MIKPKNRVRTTASGEARDGGLLSFPLPTSNLSDRHNIINALQKKELFTSQFDASLHELLPPLAISLPPSHLRFMPLFSFRFMKRQTIPGPGAVFALPVTGSSMPFTPKVSTP